MVCRGGPWPSRGTLRRRGVSGTMRASSPTKVYYNPGLRFSGWPQHLPLAVGADSISARGGFRRRKVCGTMRASSPTEFCYKARFVIFRLAAGPPWFVGEGFIPPAGVCAAAGSGGMRASRPTVARVVAAAPVGRAFAMVRRGGPNQPANVPAAAAPFLRRPAAAAPPYLNSKLLTLNSKL